MLQWGRCGDADGAPDPRALARPEDAIRAPVRTLPRAVAASRRGGTVAREMGGSPLMWAHLGSNQEQPGYEPGALTD